MADDEQRASTPGTAMPAHGWAWRWGGRVGRSSADSSATAHGAVWEADPSGVPGALGGRTNAFATTTLFDSASGGTNVLANFQTVWKAYSSTKYAIGAVATDPTFVHGHDNGGGLVYKKLSTTSAADPFGHTATAALGLCSFFFEYQANSAPSAPGGLSPTGETATLTPAMTGTFVDADTAISGYGANAEEKLNQYQIEVRRVSDGTMFWQPAAFTASPTEQGNAAFAVTYGGTTLVEGTAYEWRCRVSDQFDAWSDWTAWTAFTIADGGSTSGGGGVSGKQDTVTPGPFTGTWNHFFNFGMDMVQVRIKQGSSVVRTGAEVAKVVADGGAVSVSWAESGLTTLSWNVANYSYQMRGRDDTFGVWSSWSTLGSFSTDRAPNVPTNLSPTDGAASSSFPKLTCTATDADDTTLTGHLVKARIKDADGVVLFTRTMTLNGSTWEYQTDGTDLATFDTYTWDAYAYDGTLYSGTVTVEADAAKSASATFVYAEGPAVTLVAPADAAVLTTSTPTFDWTVAFSGGATQTGYEVVVWEMPSGTLVSTTSFVADTTTTDYVIPSGILRNEGSYGWHVIVTDTNAFAGTSLSRYFSVLYTPPDAITGVVCSAEPAPNDLPSEPTAIRVSWDQTSYAQPPWNEYLVYRHQAGQTIDDADLLARVTSPTEVSYVDYLAANGVDYVYSVVQNVTQGEDETLSDPVEGQASISFSGVVLCAARDGGSYRARLRYGDQGAAMRTLPRVRDKQTVKPWGSTKPVIVQSATNYRRVEEDFVVVDDGLAAAQIVANLEALIAQDTEVCFRDERGRKIFADVTDCVVTDFYPLHYGVRLVLTEVEFTEAVE